MSQYAKLPDLGDLEDNPTGHAVPARRRSKNYYIASALAALLLVVCLAATVPIGPSLPDVSRFLGFSSAKAPSQKHWSGWHHVEKMFVFGDSYSTTGFDVNGTQPSPDNPFGNRDRWIEGRRKLWGNYFTAPNWAEFLTDTYNTSIIQTYDFSTPAAPVDHDNYRMERIRIKGLDAESFKSELYNMFLPVYTTNSSNPVPRGWDPDSTLFAIFFGINDFIIYWVENQSTLMEQDAFPGSLVNGVIATYKRYMRELYSAGARNFVVINVPPFLRNEAAKASNKQETLAVEESVPLFNAHLKDMRDDFLVRYPDSTVFYFDLYSLYSRLIDDPKSLEQTKNIKTTSGCCEQYKNGTDKFDQNDPECDGPVGDYFWQNRAHPTYTVHNATAAVIVQDCWSGLKPKGLCS